MSVKVGVEVPIQVDKRYVQHVRGHAIGDVFDALPELLTNADDSYGRLYQRKQRDRDGGDILIEHLEQRKGQPSRIVIRDRGEGMDDKDMEAKLAWIGAYESKAGDRGYMGRGAKDCSELGNLSFESIKNERYYRCRVTHDLKFKLEARNEKITKEIRKRLGIPRGNGTSVTLDLNSGTRMPRFDSMVSDLPWHYALRDIMAENSPSRVLLRRGDDGEPVRIVYRPPEGEVVIDEEFNVAGYTGAKARLKVWRSAESLEDSKPRFERYGILVKGKRAIHECTLLSDEFKKDPNARRYFGRLECPYLDDLLAQYQERLKREDSQPPENPRLVIDPNRRFGLERQHPFVKALLQLPIERLRALLAKDRESEEHQQREVANDETRARLARLAKLAGRFLQEQLDELEELTETDDVDKKGFAKNGILIYPTYLSVGVGNVRALTVYVRRSLLKAEGGAVSVTCDVPGAIQIEGSPFNLRSHHSKEDRLIGTFKIRGLQKRDNVVITARCDGLPTADALVQVVEETAQDRTFIAPLEFERDEYRVRYGRRRTLRLFAKFPDVVAAETEVKVYSSDAGKVAVRGRVKLAPIAGTNYAEGTLLIEGRTLKSRAVITATVNERTATASVKVIDKPEEQGVKIDFEIRDEDFGNFRALWADREGKPNLLLISARHKSLRRYLGDPDNRFPGQNTPLVRALIAEIVAENVCRKALTLEARERPFDFLWADMGKPDIIVDDVFAQVQQRLRDFLAKAHEVMLSDSEIPLLEEAAYSSSVSQRTASYTSAQSLATGDRGNSGGPLPPA
jgi:hypothetical protein